VEILRRIPFLMWFGDVLLLNRVASLRVVALEALTPKCWDKVAVEEVVVIVYGLVSEGSPFPGEALYKDHPPSWLTLY
jgi:hypothetical protein